MANAPLPQDFSEFLQLLNKHNVKYLLVGGYAVGYYGYVRATADLDVWIRIDQDNAERVVNVFQEFGFNVPDLTPALFLEPDQVIRIGNPPLRLEVLTSISGVSFDECYEKREVYEWDDVVVHVLSLEHLKQNKKASGRYKDLADLEYLENLSDEKS